LKILTRGSVLALTQTRLVISKLKELHPDSFIEEVVLKTTGDLKQGTPEADLLDKRAWIDTLEEALISGVGDLAVHSGKDLPAELMAGTEAFAILEREVPNDTFIGRLVNGKRLKLAELPLGAKVGTASNRRREALLAFRSDLEVIPLRGNVTTRIKRLDEGELDGIILAAAGVRRLGLEEGELLPIDFFVPAPAQGILAVQVRSGEAPELTSKDLNSVFLAERSFARALGASCKSAIGAYAVIDGDRLTLTGAVYEKGTMRKEQISGLAHEGVALGQALAEKFGGI
jgi:hydroxymethylbilane synthase